MALAIIFIPVADPICIKIARTLYSSCVSLLIRNDESVSDWRVDPEEHRQGNQRKISGIQSYRGKKLKRSNPSTVHLLTLSYRRTVGAMVASRKEY